MSKSKLNTWFKPLLAAGLCIVLAACTADTNRQQFRGLSQETLIPTNCSADTEIAPVGRTVVPEDFRQRLLLRFGYHYGLLQPHVIRREANQILTRSGGNFGAKGRSDDGIVTRFAFNTIPVFVYSKDQSQISEAKSAIDRINDILRDGTEAELSARFIPGDVAEAPRYWARETGIHLYFGSEKCLWKVLDEQTGTNRSELTAAATINLRNLGGLTVTQTLIRNGYRTGRIHRSIVVILNVSNNRLKQSVVEHELMHALGIRGHTRFTMSSRMSQEAESIAPLDRFSNFDRQFLRILYGKLTSGDDDARVKEVVEDEWRFEENRQSRNAPNCLRNIANRQNNGEEVKGIALAKATVCDMGIGITKIN